MWSIHTAKERKQNNRRKKTMKFIDIEEQSVEALTKKMTEAIMIENYELAHVLQQEIQMRWFHI